MFLVYAFLVLLFDLLIVFVIAGIGFWTVSTWGIYGAYNSIAWILSGRLLPISLYPVWLQETLRFTPFYYLEFTLASTYLGASGIQELIVAFGILSFWILALIMIIKLLYAKAYQKLAIFGG